MNSYSQPGTAAPEPSSRPPLVLKLGGELLESAAQRANIAQVAHATLPDRPLVVIHGGGRAIDAELKRRQIAPRKIDGLRITDADTLDAVVAVLAGSANTDLVAACVGAGVPAVGLTGVDAGFGRARRTAAYVATDGQTVDLGHVGDPEEVDPGLVRWLLVGGFVPVIASLGIDDGPGASILNVNADVMACRLAAALGDCDLVIAGGTPGVLDAQGRSIPALDVAGIDEVIASGTATAGMVAKLSACRAALLAGVASVRLVDGRGLDGTHPVDGAAGTTLTR
ncbi:MAG: acetylglutamate kinase [Acidobacteria bacterium]|nr:acetylglutamate kinase [Acidobacteriota bacterium]